MKALETNEGTFENYFKLFVNGEVEYGCYFDYILDWEKLRKIKTVQNNNLILVVEFEKLKKDPPRVIKQIAHHLGLDVSEELLYQVAERSHFSTIKATRGEVDGKLLRKGNPIHRLIIKLKI